MRKLAILLALSFFLISSQTNACSCTGQFTVEEQMKRADAVITGVTISKESKVLVDSTEVKMFGNDSTSTKSFPFEVTVVMYTFLLTKIYKGKPLMDTVQIYTGLGHGDCGVNFKIGKEYIVYVQNETYFGQTNNDFPYPKGRNIYWTNSCSRTTVKNEEEISEIENYLKK